MIAERGLKTNGYAREFAKGSESGRRLMLYGAGNAGRTVAQNLRHHGVEISGFLDAGAKGGQTLEGVPIYSLDEWVGLNQPGNFSVIVSIHSAHVDVMPIVERLKFCGFARVLSMVDYINYFPLDPENRYWLVPSAYYADQRDNIDAAFGLLSDEVSRQWFNGVLELRTTGRFDALPAAKPDEHYAPRDLPRWAEPMRLVDCGAFDGDTLASLAGDGYELGAVAAFEPDIKNFSKLAARFRHLNAIFLPCGVSGRTELLRFDSGQNMSSRIDATGDSAIQCVTIDEALPAFSPTLIKMDIEGAEPAALRGAEQTIRRHRPDLAISLYHFPEHLWTLPLWVSRLNLGYRLYIRGHGHNGFELVLYCRQQGTAYAA